MREIKVYSLQKEIETILNGHTRVLVVGPLKISKILLLEIFNSVRPTAILYIDGGLKHKKKLSKRPGNENDSVELSIGDGDSGKQKPDFLLPTKKNFSDLAFALKCMEKSMSPLQKIEFLGFAHTKEQRPDHFLINLGVIEKFVLRKQITAIIHRDEKKSGKIAICPQGKNRFVWHSLFSVMTLRKNKIKISGKARYQLKDWTDLPVFSSLGLSNIGNGTMTIESTAPLIIFTV